ncbi:MAG TPA: hypothetical protein VNA28_01695 [Solirubrobacteraceae bacterium]|nr:hypothetical protein [Solirubrobacteraceae bacterium]
MATLSQGERIVLVVGVLLIVDLLFLPWHSAPDIPDDVAFDPTRTAVQEIYPGYGIAAVILTAIMVLQIVLARLSSVRVPAPGLPWPVVHLVAGIFVAVLLVIKLFRETEILGYGAYSGVLGGLLVAYGGWCISRELDQPA